MAISPGSKRRDNRPTASGDQPQDPAPLGAMQEPLGSIDRPIPRTSDDNDVNPGSGDGTQRAYTGAPVARDRGRGFTTTFAIIAAVLLAAFLVALYMGADRTNEATAPTTTPPPVADSAPGTPDDATGSTTPVQPQDTAPAPETGNSGTGTGTGSGTGTTAPANP